MSDDYQMPSAYRVVPSVTTTSVATMGAMRCPICNEVIYQTMYDYTAHHPCANCVGTRSDGMRSSGMPLRTLAILLCLLLSGCSALPPQPNAPSETAVTHTETTRPDGSSTVAQTFTHKGPQNERKTAPVAWGSKGVKIGSGTADAADLTADSVTGEPLFWIGSGVIVLGIALLVASKYPGINLTIPAGTGFYFIAGGAGIALLPFVGEAIGKILPAVLIIGGLVALAWYSNKAGWFKFMTRPEAQVNMIAKGEAEAAAAMAFLNSGGDTNKANAVKAAPAKMAAKVKP